MQKTEAHACVRTRAYVHRNAGLGVPYLQAGVSCTSARKATNNQTLLTSPSIWPLFSLVYLTLS